MPDKTTIEGMTAGQVAKEGAREVIRLIEMTHDAIPHGDTARHVEAMKQWARDLPDKQLTFMQLRELERSVDLMMALVVTEILLSPYPQPSEAPDAPTA